MVITVKKSSKKQEIEQLLYQLQPRKLFRAKQFAGKLKWSEDALEYQKRIRDEWN
jgi:hypothetical protein